MTARLICTSTCSIDQFLYVYVTINTELEHNYFFFQATTMSWTGTNFGSQMVLMQMCWWSMQKLIPVRISMVSLHSLWRRYVWIELLLMYTWQACSYLHMLLSHDFDWLWIEVMGCTSLYSCKKTLYHGLITCDLPYRVSIVDSLLYHTVDEYTQGAVYMYDMLCVRIKHAHRYIGSSEDAQRLTCLSTQVVCFMRYSHSQ